MKNTCAIILDYFGSEKTTACLRSLLDQNLDSVMVVDNSGDVDANTKLKESLSNFEKHKPSFVIHRMVNDCNLGFAAGVNKALRWVEDKYPHRYYLLINNDAQATPGMLSKLQKYMLENNDTVIVAPNIDHGSRKTSYFWYNRYTGILTKKQIFGSFAYLTGCCLLVERRIIKGNLFDEDFFMYGEDIELSWRISKFKLNIACIKDAIVLHEGVGSSKQGEFFYEYHMAKCHMILASKLAENKFEMLFLFIGRYAVLTLRALIRSLRYKNTTSLNVLFKILFSKQLKL
jgi:N-acetylglucosaminyl-diphospho-decaprenol L-rhamnosyltransferase